MGSKGLNVVGGKQGADLGYLDLLEHTVNMVYYDNNEFMYMYMCIIKISNEKNITLYITLHHPR